MSKNQLQGKWKIISMDQWDSDYINLVEPGYIEFNKNSNSGELHFGCIYADIFYVIKNDTTDEFSIEFTFQGDDEGDIVSGRGSATLIKKNT